VIIAPHGLAKAVTRSVHQLSVFTRGLWNSDGR